LNRRGISSGHGFSRAGREQVFVGALAPEAKFQESFQQRSATSA
jgi:hypothetical protein